MGKHRRKKKIVYKKQGSNLVPSSIQPGEIHQTNAWRNEPGVNDPLRIGRGIRTRDEFLYEQTNKQIHTEISKDELYRRGVVVDIDGDENIAFVKLHNAKNKQYPQVPNDIQKRRYEINVHTVMGSHTERAPIKIQQNKLELAPKSENVSEEQANNMLSHIEKTSPKNKKRLDDFRKNKSRN